MFSLELTIGNDLINASGETIPEAIEKIQIAPKLVKNSYILKVTSGEQKAELRLYPRMLKKLLMNSLTRQLFEKSMLVMLKKT